MTNEEIRKKYTLQHLENASFNDNDVELIQQATRQDECEQINKQWQSDYDKLQVKYDILAEKCIEVDDAVKAERERVIKEIEKIINPLSLTELGEHDPNYNLFNKLNQLKEK